jgi:hypothetical protein
MKQYTCFHSLYYGYTQIGVETGRDYRVKQGPKRQGDFEANFILPIQPM